MLDFAKHDRLSVVRRAGAPFRIFLVGGPIFPARGPGRIEDARLRVDLWLAPGDQLPFNYAATIGLAASLLAGSIIAASPVLPWEAVPHWLLLVVGVGLAAFSPELGAILEGAFGRAVVGARRLLKRPRRIHAARSGLARQWSRAILFANLPALVGVGAILAGAGLLDVCVVVWPTLFMFAAAFAVLVATPVIIHALMLSPVTPRGCGGDVPVSAAARRWLVNAVHADISSRLGFMRLLALTALAPHAGQTRAFSYISPLENRQTALIRLAAGETFGNAGGRRVAGDSGHDAQGYVSVWMAMFCPVVAGFAILIAVAVMRIVTFHAFMPSVALWSATSMLFVFGSYRDWIDNLNVPSAIISTIRPPFTPTSEDMDAVDIGPDILDRMRTVTYGVIMTVMAIILLTVSATLSGDEAFRLTEARL